MRRRIPAVTLLLAAGGCTLLAPADSEREDCPIPASHRWEQAAPPAFVDAVEVDRSHVRPVRRGVSDAVQALALRSFVQLSWANAARFTGTMRPMAGHGLRPYLIRAVYPNTMPTVTVHRRGQSLLVDAFALGCAPFVGHPIVVFLPFTPDAVFVEASAAL